MTYKPRSGCKLLIVRRKIFHSDTLVSCHRIRPALRRMASSGQPAKQCSRTRPSRPSAMVSDGARSACAGHFAIHRPRPTRRACRRSAISNAAGIYSGTFAASTRGLVFSATMRSISVRGISSRLPIFTEVMTPL
jgi:hypothetical protein